MTTCPRCIDGQLTGPLNIGFTGTRHGMNTAQTGRFLEVLLDRLGVPDFPTWAKPRFHHGDCEGADEQAAELARRAGCRIIGHPPANPKARAWFDNDETWPEAEYLTRNRRIVDACRILIATPYEDAERQRSGTWSTVRYARKPETHTTRFILKPSGELVHERAHPEEPTP